jgi:hypothetical protein
MTTRVDKSSVQSASAKLQSRRALLTGALAGIGAWAASVLGRATPVVATNGQPILQGADNSGSTDTLVRSSATTAFQGLADATSGTMYGVRGRNSSTAGAGVYGVAGATSGNSRGVLGATSSSSGSGVRGEGPGRGVEGISTSGIGVYARSVSSTGVYGQSDTYFGVYGDSAYGTALLGYGHASDKAATIAWSEGGSTGLLGFSGAATPPTPKPKTGVYGYAAQDSGSNGVYGESTSGRGVHGKATTGFGGYFEGPVYTTKFYELTEISAPATPVTNHARLFVRDNGLDKTQVCVKFANGTVKVLAIEG